MDTMTMTELYSQAQHTGTTAASSLEARIMHFEKDLTIRDVSDLVAQSPAVVARLVRAGYFPGAYKAGKGEGNAPWVIPYSAVTAYREHMQSKSGLERRIA